MKIAAYQAPLLASGSMHVLGLIERHVRLCEAEGIAVLCCPEAILGGLADNGENPNLFAIRSDNGQLDSVLAPLASNTVMSIVGFSEVASDGTHPAYAAAIFERGRVLGVYRKIHPAIRRSVHAAGSETPVFRLGELTFGVVICNDSNDPELARRMAAEGATAAFNTDEQWLTHRANLLETEHSGERYGHRIGRRESYVGRTRGVAGQNGELTSCGYSEIIDPNGNTIQRASLQGGEMLVAEIADAK